MTTELQQAINEEIAEQVEEGIENATQEIVEQVAQEIAEQAQEVITLEQINETLKYIVERQETILNELATLREIQALNADIEIEQSQQLQEIQQELENENNDEEPAVQIENSENVAVNIEEESGTNTDEERPEEFRTDVITQAENATIRKEGKRLRMI